MRSMRHAAVQGIASRRIVSSMNNETEILDLIAELTPALAEGRRDRVREIAVRLEEVFGAALPLDSRDFADMIDTLGWAYNAIGDVEEALRLFRNEIDIRDKLDPDPTDVLDLVSQLGFLYGETNQLHEAVLFLRRSLALRRQDSESEPAVLRGTIRYLARIEARLANNAEAERLYRELVRLTREQAGDPTLELAVDQTELASVLTQRGDDTLETKALLVSALNIQRAENDADEASLATTLALLGLHHHRRGETRLALPFFEESLRLRLHSLPESNPDVADALNNLGITHLELGNFRAAHDALQRAETLLLASETTNRDHLILVDTNLSDLYRQTGQFANAEFHARRATEKAVALFGEEHPQTAYAQNILALVYQITGRVEEALALMETVVRVRRSQTPASSIEEIAATNNLGMLRTSLGAYNDALVILRGAYEHALATIGEQHSATAFTLDNLAQVYRLIGETQIGIDHAKRAVEIRRSVQGEGHRDFAASLSNLAKLLLDDEQYAEAETLLQQAIAIEREVLGPDHVRYGIDLGTLGSIYKETGRNEEAEETDRLGLDILIRAVGPDHSEVATLLGNLAIVVDRLGDLETAIDLARDAKEINRNALGEDHPDYVISLHNLAALLVDRGDILEAQPLAAQAFEIARRTLQPRHREYSYVLGRHAGIQQELGNYALAESLLLERLELEKRVVGESHPRVAFILSDLGDVYREDGKLAEAAERSAQAVAMLREHGGESHPRYAALLSNEALVYLARGEYALAQQGLLEAKEIESRVIGEDNADYAQTFANLGTLYTETGRYAEAEECHRRAFEIAARAAGPNHKRIAIFLNNLAMLRAARGDFAEAERLLLESRDIKWKTLGQSGPDYALTLNNLAVMYAESGAHAGARRTLEQALEIERATLGPEHPMIALTLSSLAHHYITQNEMDTAEPLVRESLEMRRRIFGNAHPEVARALDILGALYLYKDELDEAERCCSEALGLLRHSFPPTHPEIARSLNNLASIHHRRGNLATAEKLQKEALEIWIGARGKEHPGLFIPFSNLSGIAAAQGRYDEALEWMQRLEALNDLIVIRTLPGSSEYRCLGWLDSMRVSMEGVLSLVIQKRMHSPAAVRIACDLVLRRKAIVFEVLARQRATVRFQGSYGSRAMNELFEQRRRLSEASLADPSLGGVEEHRRKIDALESVVEELESKIARTTPAVGLEQRLRHANRASIAAKLAPDAALVELIRFDVVNFDAVAPRKYWSAPRYAAFVIRGAKPDDVVLLDLGDAEEIDRKIDTFRTWIQLLSSSTDPERDGTALRGAVFDPILRAAPDCKRLFIAPDGAFNRLPFETLPGPSGGFVLDTHHISYVVAGRDLAEPTRGTRPHRARTSLVAADPDFDLRGDTDAPMSRHEGDFDALPGARTEGIEVAASLGVEPLLGAQVLKATIECSRSPRILHLATHGFFLPDPRTPAPTPMMMMADRAGISLFRVPPENPLLRSGLALAGANRARRGLPLPPAAGNGVLLAVDVLGLDLLGTELVVLSACESGLGDIRANEGVYGLRRTFLLAGARTLITSLWSVPDLATRTLMLELYEQILDHQPRSSALRTAQQLIRGNRITQHPFYWGAFICVGQTGAIGSRRRPLRSD